MKILDYFKEICSIPHCSGGADMLKDFIVDFAKSRGYEVEIDKRKNILVRGGFPKVALQAHYDMVCVGKAPNIELIEENGYLSAKDSSLGADNGIAIALMMALMDEREQCEFIFTSDEEIGLIGASDLEFDLKSKYMLNLDSEDEAEVYIGCAGGVDIKAVKRYEKEFIDGNFYELNIRDLEGGHSGVEIHKEIPNAIKLFGEFIGDRSVKIAYLKGGERINSIPANLRAIISSDELISSSGDVDIIRFDGRLDFVKDSDEIVEIIQRVKSGVLEFNSDLNIPNSSQNLALIDLKDDKLTIEVSTRAMDDELLEKIKSDLVEFFKGYGFDVSSEGKYPAWRPKINDFSKIVYDATKDIFGKAEFKAIHAGLECAIISDRYPDIQIASIGPTIISPHSTHERVDIMSVDRVFEVIKRVIKRVEDL